METPFDFSVELANGKPLDLASLKGKPLVIVNTATRCGLAPQFEGLEKIHQDFGKMGVSVLGMPCNQFAGQEPEADETMTQACKVNHGVSFPLTKKIMVNGPDTHPLWKLLKKKSPGMWGIKDIKWNFTKFLISPDGRSVRRYAPTTSVETLRKDLERMLGE